MPPQKKKRSVKIKSKNKKDEKTGEAKVHDDEQTEVVDLDTHLVPSAAFVEKSK